MTLPALGDVAAATAWLLGGTEGRLPAPVHRGSLGARLLPYLRDRRLAAEAAASTRLGEADLPRDVVRALAVERERARVGALAREATLARLSGALAAAGIDAVLYKGEAVVPLTHGDRSRRPMADIDVLVAPADRRAARQALLAGGFTATAFDTSLHDVLIDGGPRGSGSPHGIPVELHGDVFPPPHPFAIDLQGVLRRATPSSLPALRLPARADAIVLAAFHVVLYENDGRKALLTLRDIALLAGDDQAEPGLRDEVAAVAVHWEIGPVVAAAGRRAVAWAGAPPWMAAARASFATARLRRALAVRVALREMDAGVVGAEAPRGRVLSRRLAAALWPRSPLESARALVAGLAGPRGARSLARTARTLARHAAAAGKAPR